MKFRCKDTNNIRIMSSLHVKSNERRALLLTCVFFLCCSFTRFASASVGRFACQTPPASDSALDKLNALQKSGASSPERR